MMPLHQPIHRLPASRSSAFTLVEILVVIGIILLLSAILFPVFKSIQERGSQTTCASNMQQIYLAVRLYKDDEREYPASLAMLLPDTENLPSATGPSPTAVPGATPGPTASPVQANTGGTGYFRKTREELVCPDDDFQPTNPTSLRSSYGDVTANPTQAGTATSEVVANNAPYTTGSTHNTAFFTAGDIRDFGRLSWNYWGYDDWGTAFRTQQEALAYAKANPTQVSPALRDYNTSVQPPQNTKTAPNSALKGYTVDTNYSVPGPPAFYFNPRGFVTDVGTTTPYEEPREANMFKYSLANPQAPLSTIITHCVYHRLQTAKNAISAGPDQLYDTATIAAGSDGSGARDIVLRLDGTARSYEVSKWNSANFPRMGHGSNWQISDF